MRKQGNKIVVVGAGQVGATTAYTLLVSGLVSDLVLIDLNQKKAQGEVLDLAHGIPLCPPADIKVGDYPDCENADIVVLTAGANQKPGETRMDLTRKNIAVFRQIVPEVVKYAPHAILLVVTNPCDICDLEAFRASGQSGHRLGHGAGYLAPALSALAAHGRRPAQRAHLCAGRARRHGAARLEPDEHRGHGHG